MPALRLAGYSLAPGLLDNAEVVREWFVILAAELGVHIVNGPTIHSFKESGMPEAGLSAFAIIAESHMCLHTWPEKRWVMTEIVSCKDFDVDKAERLALQQFSIGEVTKRQADPDWGAPPKGA